MRAGAFFALAGALCGQSPDPTGVLARARDHVLERRQQLPNYVCLQTVDRQYLRPRVNQKIVPRFGELVEQKNRASHLIYLTDRLRLDVKVSQGAEIGSWAGAREFDSRNIFELVGKGPFGTGALGPFLSDIFGGGASFEYNGEREAGPAKAYEYTFHVPVDASHYSVEVGHDWHALAYEGVVRIDPQSFDLTYLLVRVSELPPESGTCEAVTSVDYSRVQMATGYFLLPGQSALHLIMSDGNESDITTKYAACHEYRGEATIHFGEEPAAATERKTNEAAPAVAPAGVPFTLALAAAIDTETAAAGDVVVEKVRKSARKRESADAAIPDGAAVRGRIVRMRHWTESPAWFEIAIRLETWETGGISRPIYARPASLRHPVPMTHPPDGEPADIETIVWKASKGRYVAAGFESNWITAAAAKP